MTAGAELHEWLAVAKASENLIAGFRHHLTPIFEHLASCHWHEAFQTSSDESFSVSAIWASLVAQIAESAESRIPEQLSISCSLATPKRFDPTLDAVRAHAFDYRAAKQIAASIGSNEETATPEKGIVENEPDIAIAA